MAGASSTLGECTTDRLKALLTMGLEPGKSPASLIGEASDPRRLRGLLAEMAGQACDSVDRLLAELVDPETSSRRLSGIKDLAKQLLGAARTRSHERAATVLYHAAIAAAFAYHGDEISTRRTLDRIALYDDLGTALGIDPIGGVFRKAVARASASM